MIAATLNVQHMLWKTGPSATELEQLVMRWMRQWLGLPEEFFGLIHDTASTSTLHAIMAARQFASSETHSTGRHPALILYTSEHAHSSIERGALALGIGSENVRHVPADAEFRMLPGALAEMIAADVAAGKKPFCVVPTLGTTSSTSVDPLGEIAAIADRHNLWLHVDAAYAGPAAILEEHRHILNGIERADSLVLNPHKWLFTPVDLSILYTRRPEMMRDALAIDIPAYLRTPQHERALNYSEYSIALGRRFRALKLWFVMRYYGREGIAKILRGHLRMARELADKIRASDNFELTAPVPFSLVCFRYRGSDDDNRALLERINASGRAYLSGTMLGGRFALRFSIGNIATIDDDMRETWDLIRQLAPTSAAGA
jgi:aromatic-L-amino-acid decarboxylase